MTFEPTELSRGTEVAWVTQGVVLYFESDLRSIYPALLAASQLLLAQDWAANLLVLRRWDEPSWGRWDPQNATSFVGELGRRGPKLPYWKIELADRPRCPTTSIDWQDLPKAQGKHARTSYLRVRLPQSTSPETLRKLTTDLVGLLPVQQGRAGYFCHVPEKDRRIGFDQAWAWARRYYGMDIIDQVKDTWDSVNGLLGVNWLTVIGKRWLDDALKDVDFDHVPPPAQVFRQKDALVLQAGTKPTTGDQNQFEDVSPYTQVSQLVEPALIESPTQFAGMFSDQESRGLWIRRFLDPTAWQEAS